MKKERLNCPEGTRARNLVGRVKAAGWLGGN